MKIAHFIDSGGLYGAEKMLIELCLQQKSSGMEPTIYSFGKNGTESKPIEVEAISKGLEVTPIRAGLIGSISKMIGIAKSDKHTLIHSHGYKCNIPLALFKQLSRIPIVSTVHGYVAAKPNTKMYYYQLLDQNLIGRLDRIITVSNAQRDKFPANRKINIETIYNGISADSPTKFKPNSERPTTLKVISIGRLSAEKNFMQLILAIQHISREGIDVSLTLVGDGYQRGILEKLIKDLGIANVALLGYQDNAEQLMSDHDCLLVCSTTEGIPITILEAMKLQIPIISTLVGGIPEMLGKDYEFRIESFNFSDISNAIRNFILSNRKTDLVKRCHSTFLKTFTSKKMHEEYKKTYLEAIESFNFE